MADRNETHSDNIEFEHSYTSMGEGWVITTTTEHALFDSKSDTAKRALAYIAGLSAANDSPLAVLREAQNAAIEALRRNGWDRWVGKAESTGPTLNRGEFAKFIKRTRRALRPRVNQTEMASRLGISRNWLSRIERGWRCSASLRRRILQELDRQMESTGNVITPN